MEAQDTPMIITIFPLVLIVLSFSVPAFAQEFPAHVISVSEGDAITVRHERRMVRIRLRGVDCPEKGQPYFNEAKRFTSFMADNRDVLVRPLGKDARGRTIADVILPGGKSLNQELLQEGLAWWDRKHSNDQAMKDLQDVAQAGKRGLWSEAKPIPPWEWKNRKRRR